MSTPVPQHPTSAMDEPPSLDIDELFLELEQLKRKRDEADHTREKPEKKMTSYAGMDEVMSGKDVMLPSSKSLRTLGRSDFASKSPKQDNHSGSGNNNSMAFRPHSPHMLGRLEPTSSSSLPQVPSSYTKSTASPQPTSSNPSGGCSASPSSHTIGRTKRAFSQVASTNNNENVDTDADISCESEAESDLFTRSYCQGRAPTRARSVSSHLSPKSLPITMVIPTTSIFSNADDDTNFDWDAFKQSSFLDNPIGSVCRFKSMAKKEFKMDHEHEVTVTNAEEDTDSTNDENEEVDNEDDAIELDFPGMESEEDPEDPDDYALSHWDEIGGVQESEGEKKWKGHGMLTRGRARLVYGDVI